MRREALAADGDRCPFWLTQIDVAVDDAEVLVGDQGADQGVGVERVADPYVVRALHHPGGELLGDVGVHQQP